MAGGLATDAELLEDYRLACVSRAVDERELILYKHGRGYFQIAGVGHEALLTGLARSLRAGYDWFFPYYRDRALVLALGVSPYEMLLQSVGSAEDAASGGRMMPSHWGSPELHIVSQSSPTGTQCLPAVGCAEASLYARRHPGAGVSAHDDDVTYVSLGEGATSEGEFWESLNTACLARLPLVYLVADNGFAISVPRSEQSAAPISELVSGFPGLSVYRIDGCDYLAAREAGREAVARARAGEGPSLVHASVTRPYSHSSSDSQSRYRSAEELAHEAARDPLGRMGRLLVERGVLDADAAEAVLVEARAAVSEAADRACGAALPSPSSVRDHVVKLPSLPPPPPDSVGDGDPVHFGESIRRALHELMDSDERIRVFGEDVADVRDEVRGKVAGLGGVFGVTRGLQERYGSDRCYNTSLAEADIVGRAVGQAVRGLRPFPEIQFVDYIWPAMQQIRSEAATLRWRSNGAFSAPIVVRTAAGGYIKGGAIWHSQSAEAAFTQIPGLLVAYPSRARDAVGLLRAALRYDDPVLFFEHKALYRQKIAMDPYPDPDYVLPFGLAETVRSGSDVTVVTWGSMVHRCCAAAELAEQDGVSAEVLDLRTLAPYDRDAIATSVSRTGRLLVAHEDQLTGGFGGEIVAFVASECFSDLDAPIRRIGGEDAWVGYAPILERAALPQVEGIHQAITDLGRW